MSGADLCQARLSGALSETDLTSWSVRTFPHIYLAIDTRYSTYHRNRPLVTMPSYASEYPSGGSFDEAYKQFFERFYEISDTPEAHEEYSRQFTSGATVIMASKKVEGTDGVYILVLADCLANKC